MQYTTRHRMYESLSIPEVRCHKKASSQTPLRSAIWPPPPVTALIGGERDGWLLWLVGGGWRVWASGLEPFSAVCPLWHKWTAGLSQSRTPSLSLVTSHSACTQCDVWRVTCDNTQLQQLLVGWPGPGCDAWWRGERWYLDWLAALSVRSVVV